VFVCLFFIQGVPGRKVNILGRHSIDHSKQKVYMYMCLIPNGFRDTDISLCSSKTVDKKKILRTVSNTGIYCWSDKVCTESWYNTFFKILLSTSMYFVTRVRTWRVARLYSVQCTVQSNSCISETVQNRTHVHTNFLFRMTATMTSKNNDLSSWNTLHSSTFFHLFQPNLAWC
jgi:hypothetical protein